MIFFVAQHIIIIQHYYASMQYSFCKKIAHNKYPCL